MAQFQHFRWFLTARPQGSVLQLTLSYITGFFPLPPSIFSSFPSSTFPVLPSSYLPKLVSLSLPTLPSATLSPNISVYPTVTSINPTFKMVFIRSLSRQLRRPALSLPFSQGVLRPVASRPSAFGASVPSVRPLTASANLQGKVLLVLYDVSFHPLFLVVCLSC